MKLKYDWKPVKEYKEIVFHKFEGIGRISINRPEVHNAFTPLTVQEMIDAMHLCREDSEIGVIILTGEGGKAFCSGGDQSVRGHGGYVGNDTVPRLNVLGARPLAESIVETRIHHQSARSTCVRSPSHHRGRTNPAHPSAAAASSPAGSVASALAGDDATARRVTAWWTAGCRVRPGTWRPSDERCECLGRAAGRRCGGR